MGLIAAVARELGHLVYETSVGSTSAEALFSADGVYRYALSRTWDTADPAVFVMLNPSTATAMADDPTIRRCCSFVRSWGCGGIIVVNVFALRSACPKALDEHPDPVGPDNTAATAAILADRRGPVVAAWGCHNKTSTLPRRADLMTKLISASGIEPVCLGYNRDSSPKHPLYVPRTAALIPYTTVRP